MPERDRQTVYYEQHLSTLTRLLIESLQHQADVLGRAIQSLEKYEEFLENQSKQATTEDRINERNRILRRDTGPAAGAGADQ